MRLPSILCLLNALAYTSAAVAAPNVQPSERVTRNVVVRATPSTNATPLEGLKPGEQLDFVGEIPGWYEVRLPEGRTGYVSKSWTVVVDFTAQGFVRAHFIDVDQGAAALLEFPCGAVMVDVGGRGAKDHLLSYLDAFFASRPDLGGRLAGLYVTHAHYDHDAYLETVAKKYRPLNFVYNGDSDRRLDDMVQIAPTTTPPTRVQSITDAQFSASDKNGFTNDIVDPLDCAVVDPRIQILSGGQRSNPGWTKTDFINPNNHSLVIRADYGAASFLISGDLETRAIAHLLERYAGTDRLNVDVFAAGHHGAENGTTEAMLRAMSPAIAVIQVGRPELVNVPRSAWDYGHPRDVLLAMLERSIRRQRTAPVTIMQFDRSQVAATPRTVSDAIYASARDGDIVVTASSQGAFQVHTSR